MLEMVQQLAGTNWLLLAFSVLIFDIPRYTLSLVSLALLGALRKNDGVPAGHASVSVIVPTFNGGAGLERTIDSLHRQTLRPAEIIVVDDGSTDGTRAVAQRALALGLIDIVICHGTRCGRSAAINHAARFASGDLLFTVDADTVFEPRWRSWRPRSAIRGSPAQAATSRSATRATRSGRDCKASSI